MSKTNKNNLQEETNEEVSFSLSNIKKANSLNLAKYANADDSNTKGMQIFVQNKTAHDFNKYFISFLHDTKSYEITSKKFFFSAAVDFLYSYLNISDKAPDNFVSYITRAGKRLSGERSFSKDDKARIFLKIDVDIYNKYLDLIYDFLKKKNDTLNPSYSLSYFFYDFIELIEKNYDEMVKSFS